jgi:hypothetical protein
MITASFLILAMMSIFLGFPAVTIRFKFRITLNGWNHCHSRRGSDFRSSTTYHSFPLISAILLIKRGDANFKAQLLYCSHSRAQACHSVD